MGRPLERLMGRPAGAGPLVGVHEGSDRGGEAMRAKVLLVMLLALLCFLAGQLWTLWVQPDLMTELALRQMERSDEAAQAMRTASQAQQWPMVTGLFVFLVVTLLVVGRKRPRR
jgi:hypothetical protein